MSKDFANRKPKSGTRKASSRGAAPRSGATRAPATRSPSSTRKRQPRKKSKQSPIFHGPSFSGGIVLGAIIVLAAAYLPEIFQDTVERTLAVKTREAHKPVQFEFDERLRSSEVRTDPDAYADDANPGLGIEMEYLIQAASFQGMDDAESLRAQLILIDMPVQTTAVQVGDKPWYRVTVGPFLSQVEAGRAMTRLRELNLDAFLIKRER